MFLRYVLVMGCLIMDVSKRLIIFHDIYCINNTQTGFYCRHLDFRSSTSAASFSSDALSLEYSSLDICMTFGSFGVRGLSLIVGFACSGLGRGNEDIRLMVSCLFSNIDLGLAGIVGGCIVANKFCALD